MTLLLDTHLLLWAVDEHERLGAEATHMITDPATTIAFSAASIWEIAIKNSLGREDFRIDARMFRTALLNNDYVELPITGQHAAMAEHHAGRITEGGGSLIRRARRTRPLYL